MKPLHPVGLIYTPLTKKALKIAFDAHRNQLDKSGIPYVVHPLHLAEQMETEEEICTALLHDVVEDSPYTLQDLKKEGFPDAVLQALELLTRQPDVPYLDYVVRLRKNPIARKVKLADLAHNSDLARLDMGHGPGQAAGAAIPYGPGHSGRGPVRRSQRLLLQTFASFLGTARLSRDVL